jgi:hypothetical protein
MGWTYEEYLEQPTFLIHGLLWLWNARGKIT